MNSAAGRPWLSWVLVVLGGGLAVGAGGLVLGARAHGGGGEELAASADLLHARLEQALQARAHALEPRATEAASLPELLSGLDLGADAHTFEDLLETEDWWAPFRTGFTVSGLVTSSGPLAMLGPTLGDLTNVEMVRQARTLGTASGIVAAHNRAFAMATARVPKGKRRAGGAVVILGAQLDHAAFQSLGDATAAAVGLSDGARVIESGGPEALRQALTELVMKQARGAVALDSGKAGAVWPLDGGLWLLAVFKVPVAPSQTGLALAIALLGAGFGFGGILLRFARRKPKQDAAPPEVSADTGSRPVANIAFQTGVPYQTLRGTQSQQAVPTTGMVALPSNSMSAAIAVQREPKTGSVASAVTMGRYRLLERVGEGGMAEIFIAAAYGVEGFVRHFVVKRMHSHLARNRDAVEQFIDEARLQSGLIHSNIVPVFDFGVADDEYFIALEYIHGRDLERVVRRHVEMFNRPMSLPVAYYIMHDVLEALAYAHSVTGEDGQSMQIVHRDVSPGNILVSFRGEVKLSDFGIAKSQARVSKTVMGTVKGNASFMAPEQARGEPVDARSDLFSAGVVLYYLLSGQFMYGDEEAVFKRLVRAAAGPAAPELIEMEKVPAAAAGVLRRALALNPKDRYQDAREFARDLAGHFTVGRAELSDLMTLLFPEHRRDPRLTSAVMSAPSSG